MLTFICYQSKECLFIKSFSCGLLQQIHKRSCYGYGTHFNPDHLLIIEFSGNIWGAKEVFIFVLRRLWHCSFSPGSKYKPFLLSEASAAARVCALSPEGRLCNWGRWLWGIVKLFMYIYFWGGIFNSLKILLQCQMVQHKVTINILTVIMKEQWNNGMNSVINKSLTKNYNSEVWKVSEVFFLCF